MDSEPLALEANTDQYSSVTRLVGVSGADRGGSARRVRDCHGVGARACPRILAGWPLDSRPCGRGLLAVWPLDSRRMALPHLCTQGWGPSEDTMA